MNETSVTIRFPADLHKALKAAAEANARSFNSEVVVRLKASVKAAHHGA